METILFGCSSRGSIPLPHHLPRSSTGGFGSCSSIYSAFAWKWTSQFAGCRASMSSKRDDDFLALHDSGAVDVIAIGSRKDSLIDFCLDSRIEAPFGVRFWTIHSKDSSNVLLSQRCRGKGALERTLELPLQLQSCPSATILVASSGVDRDHIAAIQLLNAVKSADGFSIAILLRPFTFEGQRRQQEINDLLKKLQDSSIFYAVLESDALHRTEAESFADALKSTHNAVLLTICTISSLLSEVNKKLLFVPNERVMEFDASDIVKLLKVNGELNAGFGTGYDIKSSIMEASLHSRFHIGSFKDINGTVVLGLCCAREMETSEIDTIVDTFRQITGFHGEIIFSGIHQPALENNLTITTLFVLGYNKAAFSPKRSFLQGLASQFQLLSSLIPKLHSTQDINQSTRNLSSLPDNVIMPATDAFSVEPNAQSPLTLSNVELMEAKIESDSNYEEEEVSSSNVGPGFNMAQLWAKKRANKKSKVISLDVGVKPLGKSSTVSQSFDFRAIDSVDREPSYLSKTKEFEVPGRRGALSARAESMLETERESSKTWMPVIQMQYRGGTYKGRHQSGLPEGKVFMKNLADDELRENGRLTFEDGSFYDGMWRSGRRCGLGTFCYGNGDVFQGSWKDDVMHGKGWFYFHSGDRWFANFWRGKANGEGRFYSNSGSVFFGNFSDGWRHGSGLFIDSDGLRWAETWEAGVLVERVGVE